MISSELALESIGVLAALALLPILVSWIVAVVPTRRREASGLVVGNPLQSSPLAPTHAVVGKPLVSLSRQLSSGDMGGYLLGLRHTPIEHAAPLLARYVRCADPALQLYAQSILAQGREQLQVQLVKLEREPEGNERSAAWMLETGLALASPSLTGAAERPGFLQHLAGLARARLKSCAEPSPALIANAARVFLEAGKPSEAAALLAKLPSDSLLLTDLKPAVAHALHQHRLA